MLGAAGALGPIGDPDVIARLEQDFFAPAGIGGSAAGARLDFVEAIDLALGEATVTR